MSDLTERQETEKREELLIPEIAIMGFGNPVRSDDAVGIYVIEELQKKLGAQEKISFFDMGTSAFEVLFKLKGHKRLILVDAVLNSNEPVGTLFRVPASEVMEAPKEDPMVFLHGMKWNQALSYAQKIFREDYPEVIDVFLISVENTRLEIELSDAAKQAGDELVDLLLVELKPAL